MLYAGDPSKRELREREGDPVAPPNMLSFGSVVGGLELLLVLGV